MEKLIQKTHENIFKQARVFINDIIKGQIKIRGNFRWKRKAYTKKEFDRAREIKLNETKTSILKKIKAFSYKNFENVYIKFRDINLFLKRNKTIIIAEAGVNHNGKMHLAKKLIDVASKVGADYVKFQTYDVDHLILKKLKLLIIKKFRTIIYLSIQC